MKKRTLSLLMAASMTAGLLAGCGSSKPAETTAAPTTAAATTAAETKAEETTTAEETKEEVTPVTLNIAYMPNYGSLWSIENAIDQGYLEEEGITANLVEFQDGPTIIAAIGVRKYRPWIYRTGRSQALYQRTGNHLRIIPYLQW